MDQARTTIMGAIINIILNIILVKCTGPLGAAIATFISYLCVWFLRIIETNKVIKIDIDYKKDILAYILLIVQSTILLSNLNIMQKYLIEIIIFGIIFSIYFNDLKSYANRFKKNKDKKNKDLKKIKVLHIGMSPNNGGLESFVYNMYSKMDKKKIKFDFINVYDEKIAYQDEYKNWGSKVIKICPRRKNPIEHRIELIKTIKKGNYDFVHFHTMNFRYADPILISDKIGKTKVIVHSHLANFNQFFSKKSKIMNDINKFLIRNKKYLRLACGEDAGESLFGKKQFTIIENGIDFEKYKFNETFRKDMRKKYNVKSSDILVGHVGNFSKIKNYNYLINMFYYLHNKNNNYKLILIGDDSKGEIYKEKINKLKLDNSVIYAGKINNVNEVYSAMDLFIFPSIIEGFSIALIEAQASGVQIFYSNKIDSKSNIGGNMKMIDIDLPAEKNAEFVNDSFINLESYNREVMLDNNYSIDKASEKLYEYYKNNLGGNIK